MDTMKMAIDSIKQDLFRCVIFVIQGEVNYMSLKFVFILHIHMNDCFLNTIDQVLS